MSMTVTVTTRPTTLNEAELSKKIHEAVAALVKEPTAGQFTTLGAVLRNRRLAEFRAEDGKAWYSVSGLEDVSVHTVRIDGAGIPPPKVVDGE